MLPRRTRDEYLHFIWRSGGIVAVGTLRLISFLDEHR